MRYLILALSIFFLSSCAADHEGVSYELVAALEKTEVTCEFLESSKYSKGYWVRQELDGWGLLVVTKNNNPNSYTLALMAHGHERALETREIVCETL